MARIHVDGGGSWWPSNGKLMRSGVYETSDPALIEEAITESLTNPALSVLESPEETLARGVHEATPAGKPSPDEPRPNASASTTAIELTPPQDPSGQLTSDDLKPGETGKLRCSICADGREFATQAALVSHRRNKHKDLDPSTGEPLPPAPETVPAGQPNEDSTKTVAGGDHSEPAVEEGLQAAAAAEAQAQADAPPAPPADVPPAE